MTRGPVWEKTSSRSEKLCRQSPILHSPASNSSASVDTSEEDIDNDFDDLGGNKDEAAEG